jgi:hypothetical protein
MLCGEDKLRNSFDLLHCSARAEETLHGPDRALLFAVGRPRVVDGIMKPKSEFDFEWVDRDMACAVKLLEALLEMLERVVSAMNLTITKT